MNKEWVAETLEHLSRIGRTEQNGSNRLAYTKEDREAREYFKELMRKANLTVREDAAGNIIGRLEGTDPNAPAVATGSHIDTVPNGGHYDGMVGSVGGLAAIMRLQERGPLTHPLELIIFQMEESSRFAMATFGSKVMVGKLGSVTARGLKDKNGVYLPDAMEEFGLDVERLDEAVRKKGELKCFLEMHIEQSPTLEHENLGVGIVTAIAAPIRSQIKITGKASHSGGTSMNNRKDALVTASEIVLAVRTVANRFSRQQIVGTVGNLVVRPGAMNVVPGEVELWIDLRGTNRAVMDEAQAAIEAAVQGIAAAHGTPTKLKQLSADNPVAMTPEVIATLEASAKALEIPSMRIVSGAGHDTMNIAEITDVGMIFIRNTDGLSHHPEEHASIDDIMQGLDLLTETMYQMAK